MPSPEKAFVVIPAHNEEDRIALIVEAAQMANGDLVNTDYVIVVDNKSTDKTTEKALTAGAKVVIPCEERGKGWAMNAGILHVRHLGATAVTFLDADLINLNGDHVNRLTEPVLAGAPMSIGYLGGRPPLMRKIQSYWGGFSGQRGVSLEVLNKLHRPDLKKSRIEGALNAICRNLDINHQIARVELPDLMHTGYRMKRELVGDSAPQAYLKAADHYVRIYSSAVRGLMSRSGK